MPFPVDRPAQVVEAVAAKPGPRTRLVVIDAVTSPTAMLLPVAREADPVTAAAVHDRLWTDHRIEVPIVPFGGRLWARVSAQAYDDADDYRRLADAVIAMGR